MTGTSTTVFTLVDLSAQELRLTVRPNKQGCPAAAESVSWQRDLSEAPTTRAWAILEHGVTNKSAEKRVNAIHALRLLPNNPGAQEMAESALADSNPKVRAAAARALGLLGNPEAACEIGYEVLIGERKGAHGFVASQMDELKDSKAVAMMAVETGVGFAPFGGSAYEVVRRARKDHDSPVIAAATKERLRRKSLPRIVTRRLTEL